MTRSKLRITLFKKQNDTNRRLYTKQRNHCLTFKENQKPCSDNLNERYVNNNKLFWKTITPFLSDKITTRDKIYLTGKNKLVKTDKKTPEYLNYFVSSVLTKSLYYKICSDPVYTKVTPYSGCWIQKE